jgi:hypothetical protein
MIRLFLWVLGDHEKARRTKRYLGSIYLRHFPGQITCREFESFIIDYAEGDLTERQRRVFDWHMVICPMCKVHFETYMETIRLERTLGGGDDEVPEGVPAELLNAVLASRSAP